MRDQFDAKVAERAHCLLGPFLRQATRLCETPKHRYDLQVDELRSGQILVQQSAANRSSILAIIRNGRDQNTRTDDYHLASRSAATSCPASSRLTAPPV